MLTLLETVHAIKSLDTAPDVIVQACQKVLGLEPFDPNDPEALVLRLVKEYNNIGSSTVISAFVTVAAVAAANSVTIGHEAAMIRLAQDQFLSVFQETLFNRIYSAMINDPKEGTEMMIRLLSGAVEDRAKETKETEKK